MSTYDNNKKAVLVVMYSGGSHTSLIYLNWSLLKRWEFISYILFLFACSEGLTFIFMVNICVVNLSSRQKI